MVRQGVTEAPPKTPFILGFECAGIVEAVADDVDNFKVGDRVVALPDHRAWAELVPVSAKYVYSVPETMPLQGQAVCALLQNIGGVTVVGIASKNKHDDIKTSWWQVDKVSPLRLYEDNKGIIGFNLRRLLHHQPGGHERVRLVVEAVYKLWQGGVAKAHIDSTYALEDVTDAMAKMHERRNIGKLLLDLSMDPRPKPTTPAKIKKEENEEGEKEGDKENKEIEKDEESKVETKAKE
ncbi:Synaptic vesicle membrane protein VAT-1-like 2 [Homarus americanus]|uniref:Synaptic vesicle membrane protein VAT-1-like 2 n=1 Tax=Homarus americanus TaxID=6706 RepID=A0A8J5JCL3_HOMAM|nr:Synaptic vesicle membrane protein VAT-1-like 2 [Homarus americanus]